MLAAEYLGDRAAVRTDDGLAGGRRDGVPVTVRRVKQSDVVLVQEMHTRLSKDSVYYRYLAPHTPDPEDLRRLCFLDGQRGEALVATVEGPQEKVIGMACYCADPGDPTRAEPAILVEDRYQGRGLGKRLFLELCKQAREQGVEVFECFTHLANQPVLRLINRCGLRYERSFSQGVLEIRVWLEAE
jgi:GNAT superfamily N-acetyltransferase